MLFFISHLISNRLNQKFNWNIYPSCYTKLFLWNLYFISDYHMSKIVVTRKKHWNYHKKLFDCFLPFSNFFRMPSINYNLIIFGSDGEFARFLYLIWTEMDMSRLPIYAQSSKFKRKSFPSLTEKTFLNANRSVPLSTYNCTKIIQ